MNYLFSPEEIKVAKQNDDVAGQAGIPGCGKRSCRWLCTRFCATSCQNGCKYNCRKRCVASCKGRFLW